MQNTYLITFIDAETNKMDCQIKLPFLPTVGLEILLNDNVYVVLRVSCDAGSIQIASPDSQQILTPNAPQSNKEPEILIPLIAVANIVSLKDEPESTSSDTNSNITQFNKDQQ